MYHIVIDIETTGLDKLLDNPIQIAWIVLSDSKGQVGKGSFYINSTNNLNPLITRLTGITQETLQTQGYANSVAAKKYMDLVSQYQPATLIGHNLISFDYPILHNWMERYFAGKFKQPPLVGLIDTMHLASVKFKTKKWLKLEDCAKRLEILFNREQLHNAIEDVKLTKEVYLALLD
uniref:Putative exonuclease n=1 Tax=viral metagenome TaxID=1070528 RepID=A0A6H1ZCZ3_9ZZZZ